MIQLLYKLLLCHFVGDYFFQSPFLAETKGKNWYHLFIHCVLYSIPFFVCFGWCWQLLVVTAFHFPIDALKARYNKIGYVTDQVLHYALCLLYLIHF